MKLQICAGSAIAAIMLPAVYGATVFTEDFEGEGNTDDNTLATYDKYPPTPGAWVAANQGFGADRSGMNLDGTNTVYSFRYTNSGLTTAVGEIGTLAAGQTITVYFDVAQDDGGASPYSVSLVTFNGAGRNDVRANSGATSTLASATGSATSSAFQTISFSYTADGTESELGHDLAIRIFGATTSANYDNFSVTIVPEPRLALLGGLGLLALFRRRR